MLITVILVFLVEPIVVCQLHFTLMKVEDFIPLKSLVVYHNKFDFTGLMICELYYELNEHLPIWQLDKKPLVK